MTSIGVYIRVTIALLGVAYPILLQVIARLDGKYSSEHIVGLFDKEFEGKFFKYSLIASLIFIVIWTLKLKPLIQLDGFNYFINNSANILLGTSAIVLVISFFLFVDKILIYYTPSKFIPYLQRKHKKGKSDLRFFEGLSDLLLLSIRNKQRNENLTLSRFFYSAFKTEREKSNGKPVVYPDLYYVTVHRAIEELAIIHEKRNYALEHRTAGGVWLLGELQSQEISEITYTWLWRNLRLAVQYKQDDMISYHWETAHQYFSYSLKHIQKKYDYELGDGQVNNEEIVLKREDERKAFLEFHYALGGLLMYEKRYDSIKRLFSHTNSHPPKYELLPESMLEIFEFFNNVHDPYEMNYSWISNKFTFPNQSGINSNSVVKKWISSYMAILFLRQYTIHPYYIYMKPLDHPIIPKLQSEIKGWIDSIDFFRRLVADHLADIELLEILNLTFITRNWCETNKKPYPLDFLDEFKIVLQKSYEANALNLPISIEKVDQFNDSTKTIIEDTLSKYGSISNTAELKDNVNKWYINGERMLQSKDAFSENPEAHHIDFDSFLPTALSRRIQDGVSSTFNLQNKVSYLLKQGDIFKAVSKLKIDSGYIIIGFGFRTDFFIEHLKTQGLSKEKFNETKLYNFPGSRIFDNTLFILPKTDLPIISTKSISDEIIQKYSLKKISDTQELYSSVLDLNSTTPEILTENSKGNENKEIKKSVLLSIIIAVEIIWKKKVSLVQITEYSEFRQQGLLNNINDIEALKKKNPAGNT